MMEKFSRTLRGYDPEEVNAFLDKVINQVEIIIEDNKLKDTKIAQLNNLIEESKTLNEELEKCKQKLETYERMEETINKALVMAQKTGEQIKLNAHNESEFLINDARQNANRIVNEALLRAEKTEREAQILRRNLNVFKRRIKDVVEAQLEVIEEFDKIEI